MATPNTAAQGCCDTEDDQPRCNIRVLPGQPLSSAKDRATTTGQIPRILRMPFQNLYPDGSPVPSRQSRGGIRGSMRSFFNRNCKTENCYDGLGFNGVSCRDSGCASC